MASTDSASHCTQRATPTSDKASTQIKPATHIVPQSLPELEKNTSLVDIDSRHSNIRKSSLENVSLQTEVVSKKTYSDLGISAYATEDQQPLKFIIDLLHNDPEARPFEWHTFNVFNDYLQPNTKLSADEAARCLDAILPSNRPNTAADPDDERENPRALMEGTVSDLFEYARQIPHNHESQAKLIDLMLALKRLPVTETLCHDVHDRPEDHFPFWRDAWVGWDDSNRYAIVDTRPKSGGPKEGKIRTQEYWEYISTHSFLARLEGAKVMSPRLSFGFIAIDVAAMYACGNGQSETSEFYPCYVIAGAQWIEHAGEVIWDEIRWGKVIATREIVSQHAYELPPSQWVKWLRAFETCAIKDAEAEFWAATAAKKMNTIMHRHGYSVEDMEKWTPERQTVHDGIRQDPRYAHLFTIPSDGGE